MKVNLLSSILVLLALSLFFKGVMLIERIHEQKGLAEPSSELIETAYAKGGGTSPPPATRNTERGKKRKEDIGESLEKEKKLQNEMKDKSDADKELDTSSNMIYNVTNSEIVLLKDLSRRREELDLEKKRLDDREQLISAAEDTIDKKLAELKKEKNHLETLIKKDDEKADSRIIRLVKIYETMKPKDAAKIFNDLEILVLLQVVQNMKEVKVAPIIASMNSAKAKELSMALAQQKPFIRKNKE